MPIIPKKPQCYLESNIDSSPPLWPKSAGIGSGIPATLVRRGRLENRWMNGYILCCYRDQLRLSVSLCYKKVKTSPWIKPPNKFQSQTKLKKKSHFLSSITVNEFQRNNILNFVYYLRFNFKTSSENPSCICFCTFLICCDSDECS